MAWSSGSVAIATVRRAAAASWRPSPGSTDSTSIRATRVIAAILGLVGLLLAGCGGDGPGSYVGTASNAAVYVTWTRSGDQLTGQLTQALMPKDVTGDVSSDRASFTGTVDGSAVSLTLDQGFGASTTLTGRLDGDTLTLDYPGADGGITLIRLRLADGQTFNRDLASLRRRAADAKQQTADQAAADQAISDAQDLVAGVQHQIDSLGEAAENATAGNPDLYGSDLDNIRNDLDVVRGSYDMVTSDQESGYTDTICDDAASLAQDVGSMQGDIDSMRRDVHDNTSPSLIADEVSELRRQFARMQQLDPSLLPADAPTRQQLDAAIRAAREKVREAGGAPFGRAGKLLAKANALKDKADTACQQMGG